MSLLLVFMLGIGSFSEIQRLVVDLEVLKRYHRCSNLGKGGPQTPGAFQEGIF